ncbi:MAG: DUF2272 domain-containing protein [Rhodospirillales bacterium]
MRTSRTATAALLAATLGACAHHPPPGPYLRGPIVDDPHVPPFATSGWAPFSRDAAVAIALREWRLFGSIVDDDPPATHPAPPPGAKPERQQGLWQRVGEYWWEGVPPGAPEADWTGKHGATAAVFPADQDRFYAWSAAFISYVMRLADAGGRFPYSASHSVYINAAAAGTSPILRAHAPGSYAPRPGDLICHGRGPDGALQFSDLPTDHPFASHCDIVVDATAVQLTVVGGNVDDAVTAKHVPLDPAAHLADPRYSWSVVIEVLYDAD